MFTPKEILDKVNGFIDGLTYNRKPETIYEPIKYVLSIGGKRIRPVLMLLAYNMYKDNPESILMPACALETYHNYTLLHDDLMDNADVRRGVPTVHRKWNANTAILSGDSMLVVAYQRMAQCDAGKLKPVLDLFTETALEIGEGQQYDMDVDLLYKFGEQLGLAFQLQDDLLDVYGDPKVFGKAIGGDITSNKKTYMLINALQRADAFQRAELDRWINAREFDRAEKIAAVTDIYNQLGIREICEARINHYFAESEKCLALVAVADERKAQLREFMANLLKRFP